MVLVFKKKNTAKKVASTSTCLSLVPLGNEANKEASGSVKGAEGERVCGHRRESGRQNATDWEGVCFLIGVKRGNTHTHTHYNEADL